MWPSQCTLFQQAYTGPFPVQVIQDVRGLFGEEVPPDRGSEAPLFGYDVGVVTLIGSACQ